VLERYRLDELPPAEAQALRRRLESDVELRLRLEALARSDQDLGRALPPARMAGRVRARLAERREGARTRPSALRAWPVPAGLALAATLVLALALRTLAPQPPSSPSSASPASGEEEGERTKGLRPALQLFRKTPSGSETLGDGDRARQGDVIRVGYRAFGRRYGVIVSLDGRGAVTRHLPEQGRLAAALDGGEVVLLPHAYELDDAPAWERFYFVTADEPFEVAAVEDAARRALSDHAAAAAPAPGALPLPAPLEQSGFLLTKETRP
jgi:anti-sigma factor RsiW